MEKRRMATVVHMMQYAVLVYLEVSIHIQFHQKSYRLPWGTFYNSSILQFLSYLHQHFMYPALGLHVHVYGSGVPTGAQDSPRARFAHFLYLGKIIALLVRKIHGQKVVQASRHAKRNITTKNKCISAITAYYYNSLGLDVPSDLSTFEAFAKLLHMLSSSKALRVALESNIASRSEKQAQQLNRSIWKASSAISSNSSFMDNMHTFIMPSSLDNLLLNSDTSFLYTGRPAKHGGTPDSILDGWDMVEREILPPPPSQIEDVAQWERAHNYPRNGAKKK